MFIEHYPSLVVAYLVALGGWLLASRALKNLWPPAPADQFQHPWRELGVAMIGAVGIIAMGQLWTRGIRLPEHGALGPVLRSLNQFLIFVPILLVPVVRRQPWTSAWLPAPRIGYRLLVGLVLATVAVTTYSLVRQGSAPASALLAGTWRYENLDKLVQVFLEDVAIAIVFVRLATAVGSRWATVLVASLFAAGHIPAMLSGGAAWPELAGLLCDAGLGVAVILVLQRSRDVVWFCCVHYCMDMMQFGR